MLILLGNKTLFEGHLVSGAIGQETLCPAGILAVSRRGQSGKRRRRRAKSMRSRQPKPGLDCIEYRSRLVSVSATEIGRRTAPDDDDGSGDGDVSER